MQCSAVQRRGNRSRGRGTGARARSGKRRRCWPGDRRSGALPPPCHGLVSVDGGERERGREGRGGSERGRSQLATGRPPLHGFPVLLGKAAKDDRVALCSHATCSVPAFKLGERATRAGGAGAGASLRRRGWRSTIHFNQRADSEDEFTVNAGTRVVRERAEGRGPRETVHHSA